jgi:hypothetical protein
VGKYNHENDLGLTNDIIEIDLAGKRRTKHRNRVEITCRSTEEADNKKREVNFGGGDYNTGLVRRNLQPQNRAMHKLGVLQINVYQQSIYIQKYCKSSIWIYKDC